jgi:hypothetical protein
VRRFSKAWCTSTKITWRHPASYSFLRFGSLCLFVFLGIFRFVLQNSFFSRLLFLYLLESSTWYASLWNRLRRISFYATRPHPLFLKLLYLLVGPSVDDCPFAVGVSGVVGCAANLVTWVGLVVAILAVVEICLLVCLTLRGWRQIQNLCGLSTPTAMGQSFIMTLYKKNQMHAYEMSYKCQLHSIHTVAT